MSYPPTDSTGARTSLYARLTLSLTIVGLMSMALVAEAAAQRGGGGRGPGRRPSSPARRPPTFNPPPARVVRPASNPLPRVDPVISIGPRLRVVLSLPVGYTLLQLGDQAYYYHNGVYYKAYLYDGRTAYRVVSAPVGVSYRSLPTTPDRIILNGEVYYRDGATFYTQSSQPVVSTDGTPLPPETRFTVVKPPVGAVVDTLPIDVEEVERGGTKYYRWGDVYYLPLSIDGKVKYAIVDVS